jgi:hypothetical protein
MSITCPVFPPETSSCSDNRGTCIAPNICACPDGWTGYGDFVDGTQSCDINVNAIIAIWSIASIGLFLECIGGLYLIKIAVHRVQQKIQVKKDTHNNNNNAVSVSVAVARRRLEESNWFTKIQTWIRLLLKSPTFLPGIGGAVAGFNFTCLAIVRIIYPYDGIGTGIAASIFFFFGTFSYWVMGTSFVFQYTRMATMGIKMKNDGNTIARRVKILKNICLPLVWFTAAIAGVMSIPMLNDREHMVQYATGHYVSISITCFIFCGIVMPALTGPMLHELDETITIFSNQAGVDTTTLIQVRNKVSWLRNQCVTNGLIQCALCSILAGWPFLQRKSSYFHSIAWIQGGIVGCVVIWASIPSKDKATVTGSGSANNRNNNNHNSKSRSTDPSGDGGAGTGQSNNSSSRSRNPLNFLTNLGSSSSPSAITKTSVHNYESGTGVSSFTGTTTHEGSMTVSPTSPISTKTLSGGGVSIVEEKGN